MFFSHELLEVAYIYYLVNHFNNLFQKCLSLKFSIPKLSKLLFRWNQISNCVTTSTLPQISLMTPRLPSVTCYLFFKKKMCVCCKAAFLGVISVETIQESENKKIEVKTREEQWESWSNTNLLFLRNWILYGFYFWCNHNVGSGSFLKLLNITTAICWH